MPTVQYVTDKDAPFMGQAEALRDFPTIKTYCEWMKAIGTVTFKDAGYDLQHSASDESTKTAIVCSMYKRTHTGEGGPVEPTGKKTSSDVFYFIKKWTARIRLEYEQGVE